MRFKFPKTILINDVLWNIRYVNGKVSNDDTDGGEFNYEKREVKIGIYSLKRNPLHVLNVIIHEFTEILHVENYTRYHAGDNHANYLFNYHHKEHTIICSQLAGILSQFIR